MTAIIVSAHELTKTRLCQAARCEFDAEPGWALCRTCDKRWRAGKEIVLHTIVQPKIPDPTIELNCTRCGDWKLDDLFSRGKDKGPARRGRKCECRACDTLRRREWRARLTPDQLAALQARETASRRKRDAEKRGQA